MGVPESERFPLDVLDAETEGMIGYMIKLGLRNLLPGGRGCATMLTMERGRPGLHGP
jgi:carbamate kinase